MGWNEAAAAAIELQRVSAVFPMLFAAPVMPMHRQQGMHAPNVESTQDRTPATGPSPKQRVPHPHPNWVRPRLYKYTPAQGHASEMGCQGLQH
jgi:hypothetical protein